MHSFIHNEDCEFMHSEDRVISPPWCLNGDLNSDKNDTTPSYSSKAESSYGIMIFG